jgi:signal transduction histidine kinase
LRRRTITSTLVVAVLLLLVPLIASQTLAAWRLAWARDAAAVQGTLEAAQALAAATEAAIRELVAAEEAAASMLAARSRRSDPADYLESVRQRHPALRALAWFPPEGPALAVTPTAEVSTAGWPRPPRLAGRRYAVTPTARRDGATTFWLAVPVHGAQGKQEGVLLGQVLVTAFAAGIHMPSAETGVPILVDQSGYVAFTAGVPELPGEARNWSKIAPVAAARRGDAAVAPEAILPLDPSPRLAAFAPVGQTGWVAGVARPRAEALAAARAGIAWGLLVSAGALGLGLAGAVLLGRRLTRPVEQLAAAARALGSGDGPITLPTGVAEEFGLLARALAQAGREGRRRASELEATQRRFDTLLAAIANPVTFTDVEGRLIAANQAADTLLGRGATPAAPAVPPGDSAPSEAPVVQVPRRASGWTPFEPLDLAGRPLPPDLFPTTRAIASGKRVGGVIQVGPVGGERRILSAEASPVTDADGRLIGVITLFRDLTEKREAERRSAELAAERRERTELIEALFARLPAGLALVQGADLRLRAANDRLFQLAGLPEAPLAGRRLSDLFPALVAGQLTEWIAEARATGAAVRGTDTRLEGFKRGSVYWSYTVTPLRDGGGRGDTVLVTLTDTTEDVAARVRAQRTTEQVEQKGAELDAVLQSLADGVVLLDGTGRVVALNRAAEEVLGRPAEKGVRPRLEDFPRFARLYEPAGRMFPPAEFPSALALAGETVERREAYVLTDAQQKRFLLLSATPLRDRHGRLTGAAVTFRDITREKEVESFKLQFITRAAHELRTPLTTIKGNLLLALKGHFGNLAPQQREALQTSTRNVDTMVSLIDELLDITRVESGRLSLFGEEVSLSTVLDRAAAGIAALASGKGLTLTIHGADDIVGYWDAAKVEQVFANVLSNAVKFTPPGGRVEVRIFREPQMITVAIHDTGIGIPRDKLALVFRPFVSLLRREAGIPRQRGTGLGLSIAQSIVEAHGGRMWAESEGVGRGTTVYLTLPLNHRRAERVRLNLPARVLAGQTSIGPSVVTDLSAEGASIVAPTQVLAATRVTVEIQIPAGGALTATGEIVRVEPLEGNAKFKAAVRFQALPEADRATILEWVRREREQRVPGRPHPLAVGSDTPQ